MTAEHVRCFWRWPLGHRWVSESIRGTHSVKKTCAACGRARHMGAKHAGANTAEFDRYRGTDAGGGAGDFGGADL